MNRNWKNVSIAECFGIILCSLICCLVAVIPFSLDPMTLSFETLPLLANEESNIMTTINSVNADGLITAIPMLEDFEELISLVFEYAIDGYFIIIFVNIFASIVLMLTQSKIVRKVCRVVSVIFGICLILIAVLFLVYAVSIFMASGSAWETIGDLLNNTGILFALGMFVFGLIIGAKQCRWFKQPFKF